jgi:hypothetical protein
LQTISRPYEPGDEVEIDRLYLSITGRDRSPAEFAWEWLDTWAGRGSMNLLFDLERDEGDRLIAQYSLIPTPLSVFGRPMLAGKTENCMSHPVCRGTGLYTAHEREWFEKEKERFSFFFTTAGQVTGGAVGKVRVKLGYVPFDDWANHTLWLRTGALRGELRGIVAAKGRVGRALAPAASAVLAAVLQAYSRLRRRRACGYRAAALAAADAPLDEIAALWARNNDAHGISVDRTAAYLKWRVNDDPHLRHEYVTMAGPKGLLGYAVFFVQGETMHVVDVLVDGARADLFRHLLAAVVRRARELGAARVQCLALRHSRLLPRLLRSAGFVDTAVLSPAAYFRRTRPRHFFLYIPEELRGDPRVTDPADWYITELVLEGLPRPTSAT